MSLFPAAPDDGWFIGILVVVYVLVTTWSLQ